MVADSENTKNRASIAFSCAPRLRLVFCASVNEAVAAIKSDWILSNAAFSAAALASASCLALSAKSLAGAVTTSFDGRISSSTRLKATSERLIKTAQANVDKWSKNMLSYTKTPTEAEKKQIATVQEGIDRNKERVIEQTANIVKLDAQIKEATDGKAKTEADLANAKASISTACK